MSPWIKDAPVILKPTDLGDAARDINSLHLPDTSTQQGPAKQFPNTKSENGFVPAIQFKKTCPRRRNLSNKLFINAWKMTLRKKANMLDLVEHNQCYAELVAYKGLVSKFY